MKKPKSGPQEEALSDNRGSHANFRPIAIEKILPTVGESIERKTKLTYQGANGPIEHSVDEILSIASEHPALLVDHIFWYVLLPWLGNSQEDIDSFWKAFDQEAKHKNRTKAVNGTGSANRTKERVICGFAKEIRGLREPSGEGLILSEAIQDFAQRSALVDSLLMRLGEWVVESVMSDHEAPKRLHEVLKSKDNARTTSEGDFFCAFIRLVAKDLRLPTKKSVRRETGWGCDDEDYQKASKAFSALGLAGLPEG